MNQSAPSVFISYSWDDDEHKTWVRELATRLVANGVSASLDQWHVRVGESLTEFMESKIASCDFSIIICTPNYRIRSQNRRGGVGYEQQIISGELAAGVPRKKFLPIVRSGNFEIGSDCAIPPHFLGIRALDMRSVSDFDWSFEELLREIYGIPRYVPPVLGQPPSFLNDEINPTNFRVLRLASAEVDGWYLDSAVARSQLHPETYHIAPEVERRSVDVGYLAKLSFEISVQDEEDDKLSYFQGERMWVEVIDIEGPYFVGALDNVPISVDEDHYLQHRSEILFLPEHILDIITRDEANKIREDIKKKKKAIANRRKSKSKNVRKSKTKREIKPSST